MAMNTKSILVVAAVAIAAISFGSAARAAVFTGGNLTVDTKDPKLTEQSVFLTSSNPQDTVTLGTGYVGGRGGAPARAGRAGAGGGGAGGGARGAGRGRAAGGARRGASRAG